MENEILSGSFQSTNSHTVTSTSSKYSSSSTYREFRDSSSLKESVYPTSCDNVPESEVDITASSEDKDEEIPEINIKSLVTSLSTLSRNFVIQNFVDVVQKKSFLDRFNSKDRQIILSNIEELRLDVSIDLIPDDIYWKRYCVDNFKVGEDSDYKSRWKNIYVQHYLQNKIENFHPTLDSYEELQYHLKLCSPVLSELNITQLKLPTETRETKSLKEYGVDFSWDRIDWSRVATYLLNLEVLSIAYNTTNCGRDYNFDMFKITENDCLSLGKCLPMLKLLRTFRLKNSFLIDDHVIFLVSELIDHKKLDTIDFRHNNIGNNGTRALARLLISSCPLTKLILVNNVISDEGAKYLATAIKHNSQLISLNLSLNNIEDEGAIFLCRSLIKNTTLKKLSVSGNRLNKKGGEAFAYLVKTTCNLIHLDLSANDLGVEVGFKVEKAVEINKELKYLDVRFCGFNYETELSIEKIMSPKMEYYDEVTIL